MGASYFSNSKRFSWHYRRFSIFSVWSTTDYFIISQCVLAVLAYLALYQIWCQYSNFGLKKWIDRFIFRYWFTIRYLLQKVLYTIWCSCSTFHYNIEFIDHRDHSVNKIANKWMKKISILCISILSTGNMNVSRYR